MTIQSTFSNAVPRNRYACNGATETFNIVDADSSPVIFSSNDEIKVWHYDATDDGITLLTEGVDYNITGGPSSGVINTSVSGDSPHPTGDYIAFERRVAASQDTNLKVSGQYQPSTIMSLSGKSRQLDQDVISMVLRSAKRHPVFGDNTSFEIPYGPNKVMVGSSDGGIALSTLTDTQLAAIETNASASETAAAASAAASATSAAASAASAAAASTSESNSATSESNSSASETAAAASAASAATSAASAAAASENLGFTYTFDIGLSGDPGSAKFGFDSLTFASITTLRISETAGEGDISALQAVWDDSNSSIKATIRVRNPLNSSQWMEFYITGSRTDNGDYSSFPVSPIAQSSGTQTTDAIADETQIIFGVFRNGDAGTGAVDSWNSRTGAVLPAAGDYDDNQITSAASATNYTPTGSHVEGHLAGIDTALGVAKVDSFNSRTGTVSPASGDYDDAEITAAASATNYTPGGSHVDGHLSGIDTALGTRVTTNTDQTITGDKVFSGVVSSTSKSASSSSGSLTLDFSDCNIRTVTLTENVTSVSITAPPDGTDCYIIFTNGSGPYSVTGWPAAVDWDLAGEPDLTLTTNGNRCRVQLTYIDSVYLAAATSNHGG